MRLISLLENTGTVWYHGSPEGQKLSGGFQQRTISVGYLKDYKQWEQVQAQLNQMERGSSEYFELLDFVGTLKSSKTIRAPIFFSNNRSVAATYADDSRAWDYQSAEPKVFTVQIEDGKNLRVNAHGQNFRGITIDAVTGALSQAGIDEQTIRDQIGQFSDSIRGAGSKISTDRLAFIAHELGFDTVDVTGVKDTYTGGGPPATVRMVFDPAHIKMQG